MNIGHRTQVRLNCQYGAYSECFTGSIRAAAVLMIHWLNRFDPEWRTRGRRVSIQGDTIYVEIQ